ncbi:CBS domain-containing protein [Sansalvadorimonas verongulae]|uniref:CBS domain-containing protein n=1 Tax=Sansalvadorimonas verongulae TaxID=2172824 RepID=UPI0012BCC8FA|nr:CBS domain-containing protein [Sansalvadorimonas verongulae]MTI14146.1 CBS domain-containing protein [Sansalvadorimonas verongulae]
MRSITVEECMTRSVVSLNPCMEIVEAIRVLLKHNITAAPVVNEDNGLVGILSETDCLQGTFTGSYYSQGSGLVSEFMEQNVVTARCSESIMDVYERCMAEKALRVPVLNEDGLIAGMLSPKDLMTAVLEFYEKPIKTTA